MLDTEKAGVDEAALQCTVPVLSVQPLVENSIKHAFNPRSAPGTLSITVRLEQGNLHIDVVDDGPGCDPSTLQGATGLGVKTVQRRLALLHGERGRLHIVTHPGAGFGAHLSLPP